MSDLNFRIDLLQQAGQLFPEDAEGISNMITLFADEWQIELDEENAAMFVTHFAMALKRARDNQPVARLDEAILTEILNAPTYVLSEAAFRKIEALFKISLPESERGYIYLHLNKYFEELLENGGNEMQKSG